jgi:hypothetical protein
MRLSLLELISLIASLRRLRGATSPFSALCKVIFAKLLCFSSYLVRRIDFASVAIGSGGRLIV